MSWTVCRDVGSRWHSLLEVEDVSFGGNYGNAYIKADIASGPLPCAAKGELIR
jgi:hypothetical protein